MTNACTGSSSTVVTPRPVRYSIDASWASPAYVPRNGSGMARLSFENPRTCASYTTVWSSATRGFDVPAQSNPVSVSGASATPRHDPSAAGASPRAYGSSRVCAGLNAWSKPAGPSTRNP